MTGVRLRRANGPREVGDELVLSTGAISSPTILLLSGSAPAPGCAVSESTPPSAAPGAGRPADHPVLWLVLQRTRGVGLVG